MIRVFIFVLNGVFITTAAADSLQIPVNDSTGLAEYSQVVQIDSTIPAADLYLAAKTWAARSFTSLKNVTQVDDKESGTIICKGNILTRNCAQINQTCSDEVSCFLTVKVKNGRYKYTFDNLNHTSCLGARRDCGNIAHINPDCKPILLLPGSWQRIRTTVDTTIREWIAELNKTMIAAKTDENW